MIRLCIKLLSTGSAMMWEGGRETTKREQEKERRGGEEREGGREEGREAANGSFL